MQQSLDKQPEHAFHWPCDATPEEIARLKEEWNQMLDEVNERWKLFNAANQIEDERVELWINNLVNQIDHWMPSNKWIVCGLIFLTVLILTVVYCLLRW